MAVNHEPVALLAFYGLRDLVRRRVLVRLGTWFDATVSPRVYQAGVRKAMRTVAKASAERDSSELLIASAAAELEDVKASLTNEAKAKLTALARQRTSVVASSRTELSKVER